MARWDDEELNWEFDTFPNAPCHTCTHRDKGHDGGSNLTCDKYHIPRYSIGISGKPHGILEGTKPCMYYKKDSP